MTKNELGKQKIRIPMIFMCMYFLAVPLSIIPMPGGISLLKLISAAIGGLMIPMLFFGDNEIKINPVHILWMIYLTYSLSTMFMLRNSDAIDTFRGLIETTAIGILLTIRVYNEREKNWIYNSWILVGVIMVLLMLFSSGGVQSDEERQTLYIMGSHEDANQISGYFILPILVCMERLIRKQQKSYQKLIYIALIGGILYCVFLTGSRGGLISLIISAFVFVVMSVKGVRNKIILIVVGILGFIFVMYVVMPLLPESVAQRYSIDRVLEDRGTGRFDIWITLLTDLTKSAEGFLVGNGFISTSETLAAARITNSVAHNHIIQLMYDQGVIGCILFLSIIVTGFFRMFKRNGAVSAAVVGMMALGMSLTLYPYYKPFWNVLMMTAVNFEEGGSINAEGEHSNNCL